MSVINLHYLSLLSWHNRKYCKQEQQWTCCFFVTHHKKLRRMKVVTYTLGSCTNTLHWYLFIFACFKVNFFLSNFFLSAHVSIIYVCYNIFLNLWSCMIIYTVCKSYCYNIYVINISGIHKFWNIPSICFLHFRQILCQFG